MAFSLVSPWVQGRGSDQAYVPAGGSEATFHRVIVSEPAGSDPFVPPPPKASSSQAGESWKIPIVSARPSLLSEEELGLRVCRL